jgi:hypothetical protein
LAADAPEPPRTLEATIDRVQIEWAALEYVVSGLSVDELERPGPEGWSVKDHLAHIGAWDAALAAVLARRPEAEGFGLDPAAFDGIDALNDALYQRSRSLSMDEVQAAARRAHAEMLAALGHLSDADLDRSEPTVFGVGADKRPLRERIEVDSYAHYAEHVGWIKTLLSARPPD